MQRNSVFIVRKSGSPHKSESYRHGVREDTSDGEEICDSLLSDVRVLTDIITAVREDTDDGIGRGFKGMMATQIIFRTY